MKLNNNNAIENKLFHKILKNFTIKIIIYIVAVPLIIFIISEIISRMDFNWLYRLNSNLYYTCINIFDMLFSGYMFLLIPVIWIIGIIVFFRKMLKKIFSYISELSKATNQILDKDVSYIQLPPELEEIAIHINQLKQESEKNERLAKESEQRKNDLIVYLAHDLKTPLTSVIGYLELLKESPDLPLEQRVKYTNITLDKAYRLEELMNEFFEIARFNDINIVLMKQNLNLKFLLQQLIDEFYPLTNEQNKNIEIHCNDTIMCYADPDKLSRALNNVIKNAISYSFENTSIDIDVSNENGLISISITNHGYTIPKDKLDSIFEKFYRLDDSRNTNKGGAGLGLAIAKEIITLHNGTITAESFNDITTFMITIPENSFNHP